MNIVKKWEPFNCKCVSYSAGHSIIWRILRANHLNSFQNMIVRKCLAVSIYTKSTCSQRCSYIYPQIIIAFFVNKHVFVFGFQFSATIYQTFHIEPKSWRIFNTSDCSYFQISDLRRANHLKFEVDQNGKSGPLNQAMVHWHCMKFVPV